MKKFLILLFLTTGIVYGQEAPPSVKKAINDSLNTAWDVHFKLQSASQIGDSLVNYPTVAEMSDSIDSDLSFFSITIDNPTSSENETLFWNTEALKLVELRAVITTNGGNDDSIKVNIAMGNLRSIEDASVFNGDKWVSSTNGIDLTSQIYYSTLEYDSWIWFKTSDKVGTVNSITLTGYYTKQ